MTRKIKFRAWDKEKKEWLLGYELPNLGGFSMIGETMMMGEYASLLSSYFPDRLNDIVLMQYTGLKDKNGKEIYEGDICTHHYFHYNGKIEWINGALKLVYTDGLKETLREIDMPHYEIIGNIYENPELLA